MNSLISFLLPIIQISMLDIVLSGDNVGVIALAIRNVDPKKAKLVSIIGIFAAVMLRIFFASVVTIIMSVEWLPIKLAGGILLLKITWDLINDDADSEGDTAGVKSENSFWKAVISIVLADISMGLDNVLAIAGAANGHINLIAFGVMLNIPILFFGSQFVANLMKKYKITIYIGGAILMHTALSMILQDKLLLPYVNHVSSIILSWLFAAAVLGYGFYKIRQLKEDNASVESEN